jgi:hypothetical protein
MTPPGRPFNCSDATPSGQTGERGDDRDGVAVSMPRRRRFVGIAFLGAAVLFALAAATNPRQRPGSIALAVVFGAIGAGRVRPAP